ncbi:hypothetical protein SORBI_3009G128101 [Sorghum bicolor]|uniref:Uncharacterized protein n=1 Tax=Sorghum bicolor TaxID=4558 RepID=A0A1Z5R2F5_SORBI|nr:hypothetical protein SORBI_3009G128101 [Sorghum bicolor]
MGGGEEEEGKKKKKLEKVRNAARQQVGKLVIIAACLALLVCGTCTCSHPKRTRKSRNRIRPATGKEV